MAHFLVIRSRGAGWIVDQPLDGQLGWPEHAAFMGRLVEAGSVLLGGPVETTDAVLLLVRAADGRLQERSVQTGLANWEHTEVLQVTTPAWPILIPFRRRPG